MNADGIGHEAAHVGEDERHAPDMVSWRHADRVRADGRHLRHERRWVRVPSGSRTSNAQESDPAWSPDGDWIAYIKRTPGTPVQNLWVMHPDGSGRRALTKQTGRAFTPAWSPDSTRIVFSHEPRSERLRTLHCRRRREGSAQRRSDCGRQLRAVMVAGRIEDRVPGGRCDLHRRARRRRRREADGQANNDSSPAWNPQPPASGDE